jgi:adenylyl-sulfate kinase
MVKEVRMGEPSRSFAEAAASPQAAVVWFTGLSGSGKSTIARRLRDLLVERGVRVELLDGDEVRRLYPVASGFDRASRDAHVGRTGFLASRMERNGAVVVCALISPYAKARDHVRSLCRRFIEVYVSTSLAECERRDTKGLYARARRGEIQQMTGIDDPYEPPLAPEITIDTLSANVDDAARLVLQMLGHDPHPTARAGR